MKNLKFILFLCLLSLIFMSADCEGRGNNSDSVNAVKQEQVAKELDAQTGFPAVGNAVMKKQLKMIIEECDKPTLICYAYTFSEMTGKYTYFGKCIGYGIPYATQYTNPLKVVDQAVNYGYLVLPQADPDGLFKPTSSDATWLMMIDPSNPESIKPVYVEPDMIVSPFKLQ